MKTLKAKNAAATEAATAERKKLGKMLQDISKA